jgi:hypothetical protein
MNVDDAITLIGLAVTVTVRTIDVLVTSVVVTVQAVFTLIYSKSAQTKKWIKPEQILTSGISVDVTVVVNSGPYDKQSQALVIMEKSEDTKGSRLLESLAASALANSKTALTFSAAVALLLSTALSVGAGARLYLGTIEAGVTVTVDVARVAISIVRVDVVWMSVDVLG